MVLWPSGPRRWIQVPLPRGAWVQIPLVPFFLFPFLENRFELMTHSLPDPFEVSSVSKIVREWEQSMDFYRFRRSSAEQNLSEFDPNKFLKNLDIMIDQRNKNFYKSATQFYAIVLKLHERGTLVQTQETLKYLMILRQLIICRSSLRKFRKIIKLLLNSNTSTKHHHHHHHRNKPKLPPVPKIDDDLKDQNLEINKMEKSVSRNIDPVDKSSDEKELNQKEELIERKESKPKTELEEFIDFLTSLNNGVLDMDVLDNIYIQIMRFKKLFPPDNELYLSILSQIDSGYLAFQSVQELIAYLSK